MQLSIHRRMFLTTIVECSILQFAITLILTTRRLTAVTRTCFQGFMGMKMCYQACPSTQIRCNSIWPFLRNWAQCWRKAWTSPLSRIWPTFLNVIIIMATRMKASSWCSVNRLLATTQIYSRTTTTTLLISARWEDCLTIMMRVSLNNTTK